MPLVENGAAGNGGSSSALKQTVTGDPITVANGDLAFLTWDTLDGDDLIDIADPAHPTAKVAGSYTVSFQIATGEVVTAAGTFEAIVTLGGAAAFGGNAPPSTANQNAPTVSGSATWPLEVGDTLTAAFINQDGAISHTTTFTAWIVKT